MDMSRSLSPEEVSRRIATCAAKSPVSLVDYINHRYEVAEQFIPHSQIVSVDEWRQQQQQEPQQ